MDVAVIIPLYNGERWIGATLESVLNQRLRANEIVVVDDCSDDRSLEVAASFPGVTVLKNPVKCAATARDHGLKRTRAEAVAFLDQDDLWSPTHLERLAALLEKHPEAPAVAAAKRHFSTSLAPVFDDDWPITSRVIDPWKNFPFGTVDPSQVLLRRETLDQTGGYLNQTPLVADVQLYLRASLENAFLESEAVTVGKRDHGDSLSNQLRNDGLDRYLESLLGCSEALERDRRKTCPGEGGFLDRRLELARTLRDLAASEKDADQALAVRSRNRLLRILGEEPEGFRRVILDNFAWFFHPYQNGTRRHRWLIALWSDLGDDPIDRLFGETLERMLAPLPILPRLKCLEAAGDWRQRRKLLIAWDRHRSQQRKLRWQGQGIDGDGWMRTPCHLELIPEFSRRGISLLLEIPPWLGTVGIEVDASSRFFRASLGPGRWRLRFPADAGLSRRIRFVSDAVAEIPGDGRLRSGRLVEVEEISKVSTIEWERVSCLDGMS